MIGLLLQAKGGAKWLRFLFETQFVEEIKEKIT